MIWALARAASVIDWKAGKWGEAVQLDGAWKNVLSMSCTRERLVYVLAVDRGWFSIEPSASIMLAYGMDFDFERTGLKSHLNLISLSFLICKVMITVFTSLGWSQTLSEMYTYWGQCLGHCRNVSNICRAIGNETLLCYCGKELVHDHTGIKRHGMVSTM